MSLNRLQGIHAELKGYQDDLNQRRLAGQTVPSLDATVFFLEGAISNIQASLSENEADWYDSYDSF